MKGYEYTDKALYVQTTCKINLASDDPFKETF